MSKKNDPKGSSFVERVREDASRYLSDLVGENEKLRSTVGALEQEVRRLTEESQLLARRLEFERAERDDARRQLGEVERENKGYMEQYNTVQEQISDLANLYVAAYRLNGTLRREQVIASIEEIVINLIGSEELAVFERTPGTDELTLISSVGIEPSEFKRITLGSGLIGRVAQSGEAHLPAEPDNERAAGLPVTACVPLMADGELVGALTIFRLLQQKPSLREPDHEMLRLLGTHAATALVCTRGQTYTRV